MRRACVIGWPIRHSRSPLIHGFWLRQFAIDGEYSRVAVPPGDLKAFVAAISPTGFVGCNVTIPHKEAVLDLVHVDDPFQRRIGSINTVYIDRQNRIAGESTDGIGFWRALEELVPTERLRLLRNALVVGAGGASRAVVAALVQKSAANITLVARDPAKAETFCRVIDETRVQPAAWRDIARLLPGADLIVNTTPLGMAGYPDLDVALEEANPTAVVYDLVYVPLETAFLRRARALGLTAIDGLGMLLHQAAPGFERWFGVRPPVTAELRALVVRDIETHT